MKLEGPFSPNLEPLSLLECTLFDDTKGGHVAGYLAANSALCWLTHFPNSFSGCFIGGWEGVNTICNWATRDLPKISDFLSSSEKTRIKFYRDLKKSKMF